MRMSKKSGDIELICQKCGSLCNSLKEYVQHKKEVHYTRITDTVESLRQLGFDDPSFDKLLDENPKEKVHPEYIKEAKRLLKSHMQTFTK